MTKASRDFEQLVARIEGVLAPSGAVVISPDRIPDIITRVAREVDASVRVQVGSVSLLITIECRDRVDVEDVTWIEQLATKQKHVGAAHTVAVSSKGFTKPAIAAARAHGISVRTVSEVTDATILAWVDTLEVEEVNSQLTLDQLALVYEGEHADVKMDVSSQILYDRQGWDAPIFLDRMSGATMSLAGLIGRAADGRPLGTAKDTAIQVTIPPLGVAHFSNDPLSILAQDANVGDSPVQQERTVEFVDDDVVVNTRSGPLKLRRLVFRFTVSRTRRVVSPSRVVSYAGEGGAIADVSEREVEIGQGRRFLVTQHRLAPNQIDPGK